MAQIIQFVERRNSGIDRVRAVVMPVVLIVLCGFLASPAFCQDKVEKYAKKRAKTLKAELNLSGEQTVEVEEILLDCFRSMQGIIEDGEGASGDEKETVMGLMEIIRGRNKDLQEILTDDQWSAYEEKQADRAADMQTEILRATLGLSESQADEIYQINLDTARQVQAYSKVVEEGSRRKRRRAARSVRSVLQARDEKFEQILTPKQWETYEVIREELKEIIGQRITEEKEDKEDKEDEEDEADES